MNEQREVCVDEQERRTRELGFQGDKKFCMKCYQLGHEEHECMNEQREVCVDEQEQSVLPNAEYADAEEFRQLAPKKKVTQVNHAEVIRPRTMGLFSAPPEQKIEQKNAPELKRKKRKKSKKSKGKKRRKKERSVKPVLCAYSSSDDDSG